MEKNPQVAENNPFRFSKNRSARKNFRINPFGFVKICLIPDLVAFILKNPPSSIAYNVTVKVVWDLKIPNFPTKNKVN